MPNIPGKLKPYLSAAARLASEKGSPILLSDEALEDLASPHQSLRISQRVERVLQLIGQHSEMPGGGYRIDTELDYPLADCRTAAEFREYLLYLTSQQLVQKFGNGKGQPVYSPTIAGWQTLEPTLPVGGEPDRCFVAMWFDSSLDPIYAAGFEQASLDCGFKAYRQKEDPTNKGITDKILSEIRRAHFVIADFTGQRQSVYYEAGFAVGLGREVISCCREDFVKDLTFDTRHLGHIVWKDAAELREKLRISISANIIPRR